MNSNILQNIILFISLLLLQVILLNSIELFGYINPFLYILFVILFPYSKNRGVVLFFSFLYVIAKYELKNDWKKLLPRNIKEQIEKSFVSEMKELNYL